MQFQLTEEQKKRIVEEALKQMEPEHDESTALFAKTLIVYAAFIVFVLAALGLALLIQ